MANIKATVKDCQPNGSQPALDLYFPREIAAEHGWQHRQAIEIVLEDVLWRGTIGIKPPNAPYLHVFLTHGEERLNMRQWLLRQGVAHGAVVELSEDLKGRFRWNRIIDNGAWSPGTEPTERTSTSRIKKSTGTRRIRRQIPEARLPLSTEAFPISDRQAIIALSEEYWNLITDSDRVKELLLEREMPNSRQLGYLDRPIFLTAARWKSPRPKRFHESNSEDQIQAATEIAFKTLSDEEAVAALAGLSGVRLRTATALLHWMRPHRFPILDVRVVAALQVKEPTDWDDVDYYTEIAEICRGLARKLDIDLRTLDRALWAWDKLRSKG